MKKNTDFANSERKIFIAKTSARSRRKTDRGPAAWPYYGVSAALMLVGMYMLYAAYW